MTQQELIKRLETTCFGLDPIDPLRLLVDDVVEALRENAMREVQRLGQEIENEPVAWMHIQGRHQELSHFPLDDGEISRGWEQYPLYTAPPQRTWVGLTDEEENEYNYLGPDMYWVIQEIEAKLKEKNNA